MTRRVALVHSGADLYGADLVCLRIAGAAVASGWAVTVVVPRDGPLVPELRAAGAEVVVTDPLVLRRSDLRGVRALSVPPRWVAQAAALRRLARRRFDVVHTRTAPTLGGFLLARWSGARHVLHVQEIFSQPRRLVRTLERVFARADSIVCISRAVAEQFDDERVRSRTRIIHTGVDVPDGLDERVPLDGPSVDVVCVARLNEWKGQEVLIAAAYELGGDVPGLRVRLVGDVFGREHQYRDDLEAQIAYLRLGGVVVFEGERRDALSLVARSDILVLPSRRPEPFGMALVEGMALGRPVVATAAGGPAEIITDGVDGLLVPPGDATALADAIRRLAADRPAARAMGERGRRRAADFPVAAMVGGVLALYEELTG